MRSGFTLIELIITATIGLTIFSLVTVNLLSGQRNSAKSAIVLQMISDLKTQQLKSMTGAQNASTFGMRFANGFYTLFGSTDDLNISLDNSISISSNFSGNTITFLPLSGEIQSFVNGQNNIFISDNTDGTTFTLTVNRYGVVESKN